MHSGAAAWLLLWSLRLAVASEDVLQIAVSRRDAGDVDGLKDMLAQVGASCTSGRCRERAAGLYLDLGSMFYRTSRFAEAVEAYGKAAPLAVDAATLQRSHYNLGQGHMATRQWNDAVKEFREAAALESRASTGDHGTDGIGGMALASIAAIFRAHGMGREAVTHYEDALRLLPSSPVILENLVDLLKHEGREEDADHYMRELCTVDESRCPLGKRPFLVVGERNTGTNWISKMVLENLGAHLRDVEYDPGTPWKHAAFSEGELAEWPTRDAALVIGVVKDPYAWFHSMWRNPHHAAEADAILRGSLGDFLDRPWKGLRFVGEGEVSEEEAASIVDLRSQKLRGLLSLRDRLPGGNFMLVTYEEVLRDPEAALLPFFEAHGIRLPAGRTWETIDGQLGAVHRNPSDAQDAAAAAEHRTMQRQRETWYLTREYMPLYTPPMRCAIAARLESALEAQAGYGDVVAAAGAHCDEL